MAAARRTSGVPGRHVKAVARVSEGDPTTSLPRRPSVRKLLILALALVAALGVVSSASAKPRDRNHDRLPDRWERAHHLSLKVKQGHRDQDRDGLNNRGEFRAKTNPRDADTDNDGIRDGKEHAGTVKSFEGGVLTITLAQGGELAATVDDATEIECHSTSAKASRDGADGNSGPSDDSGPSGSGADDPADHDAGDDNGDDPAGHDVGDDHGDDPTGDDHGDDPAGDDQGDDDAGDDQGEDENERCGTDALTAGTKVDEAEMSVTSAGKRWRKVELGGA